MPPIDAQTFTDAKQVPKEKQKGRNQVRVLAFLENNPTSAYTQTELQDVCEIEYAPSVNSALHALQQRGMILMRRVEGRLFWAFNPNPPPQPVKQEKEEEEVTIEDLKAEMEPVRVTVSAPVTFETRVEEELPPPPPEEPIIEPRHVEEVNQPMIIGDEKKKRKPKGEKPAEKKPAAKKKR